MKKALFLIMCLLNCIWASAQFSGSGNGTANDPYLVYTPTQLYQLNNFLGKSDVVFKIMTDMDLSDFINENFTSEGWTPIGTSSSPFKGTLIGAGHKISGLWTLRGSIDDGGTVADCSVENAQGLKIKGAYYVGGFIGYAFGTAISNVTVSADLVSYQRTVKNQWGTLCVPFELTSDATTQYYKLKSVSTNSMLFAPVATVEAGTPVVFKTTGTLVSASAKDAELKANNVAETDATGWTMNGTYEAKTINPAEESNDIYYISENQFVYGDVAFPVPAYRGYFETSKGGVAKAFSYSIDAEKGNDTTGIGYMENQDGTVTVIYDLNGIRQSKPNRGLNIINGKKVIVK